MTDPTGAEGDDLMPGLADQLTAAAGMVSIGPSPTAEEVRLLGQPSLDDHLHFVGRHVVDGASMDRAAVADRWRQANDRYGELETTEAGIADEIDILPPEPYLAPLIEETEADPRYNYTFDTFPTEIAMVELDRLVVFQTHITRSFADGQAERLVRPGNLVELYRFCQPLPGAASSIEFREMGRRHYVFSSPSTDLRQHEPVVLRPEQVSDHRTFGPVGAYIGIPVGFGSNFFTGIRYGDRVLLHNGYHRAIAMRMRGITHAPCIIQTVTRRDELEVAAKRQVADDPAFYFAAARPPLLKDFFDARLAESFEVYATRKMIEVTFDVREFSVLA
ncbi:MAG: hypothetical protein AAGA21_24615 [Pseudomonadota bacterium]